MPGHGSIIEEAYLLILFSYFYVARTGAISRSSVASFYYSPRLSSGRYRNPPAQTVETCYGQEGGYNPTGENERGAVTFLKLRIRGKTSGGREAAS